MPINETIPADIRAYTSASLQRYLVDLGQWAIDAGIQGARKRGHMGLRPAHNHVLAHLDLEGSRVTDIARRLNISNNAVGQLVSDLEEMGYVERVPDGTDRRAKILRYTPRGISLLRDAVEIGEEIRAELAELLGPEDLDRLIALLGKLHGLKKS